jgi:hypothetical protein
MSVREKFTNTEWDRLRLLPFVIFEIVADVDLEVDYSEVKELLHELRHPGRDHEQLHRELFAQTSTTAEIEDFLATAAAVVGTKELINREVAEDRSILQTRLSDEEYRQFIASMIRFASKIAGASGVHPHRIDDLEQLAIDVLADSFGVPNLEVLLPRLDERRRQRSLGPET